MTTGFQTNFNDLGWDEDKLTPAECDVWNFVQCGPHGPRENARISGRSPGTVGNLLRRAKAKLWADA
jgi:DNA-binding CsgD family transcriptional regulator